MTNLLVLVLVLVFGDDSQRTYRPVPLKAFAAKGSQSTHVETCGQVVYLRKMRDGDIHITLALDEGKMVLEIVPRIPLPRPTKGYWIIARGISRYDEWHNWWELHPLEEWRDAAVGCLDWPLPQGGAMREEWSMHVTLERCLIVVGGNPLLVLTRRSPSWT